jgi:hypothetical protein
MFTSDDYFNATNARILNENVNHLDERKYEPNERSGGLRAKETKAGGHGTLVRKEEFDVIAEYLFVEGYADTIESAELIAESISAEWVNDILDEKTIIEYLFTEGYANSYEEAEYILEDMSYEEFENLLESSGMTTGNRKTLERLVKKSGTEFFTNPRTTRSARKREPEPEPQRRRPTTDLSKVKIGEDYSAKFKARRKG